MNLKTINVIIKREYLTRVKKKSFLFITFLGPIFFAAIAVLPSIIMFATKEKAQKVAVVDQSGIVLPVLENSESAEYLDYSTASVDSLKGKLEEAGLDILLHVSPLDEAQKTVSVVTYSKKPLGMDMSENLNHKVNQAVENYRVSVSGVPDLDKIMESVKSDIRLTSYTLDEEGKETISANEVYMLVSMLFGMIIYMFIALFCGMVMSSVIEEKSSRVVEVLVSSVKSTELMFGKIIGVAAVALTQFLLWVVLTLLIVSAVGGIVGMDKLMAGAAADPTVQMAGDMVPQPAPDGLGAVVVTLQNLPWGQIIVGFLVFFVLGYLLYASLFAAIGSAVENEADTQQLQIPVTIPLLLGFFIAFYAFKNPDSSLVFWGSMIPFTSPIVMMARLPFGVPGWELALSVFLLLATFVLCAWASAKIYRVGVLMFGKKSTFKDLWKWLKMK